MTTPDQESTTLALPEVSRILGQTQPWARLMGIVGFVTVGMMLLFGLGAAVAVLAMQSGEAALLLAVYPLMAVLYVLPSIYLMRYANRIRDFIAQGQQHQVEAALDAQWAFWKFMGIFALVSLVLSGFAILVALVFGVAGGFMVFERPCRSASMRHTIAAVAVASLALTASTLAQSEIRVFTGGAMSEPVREVGNAFAKSSGHRLVYVTDTTGALSKRLASGERADVIVVTSAAIQALEKDGKVAAGSRVDLARALIGVAVKAGAPSPDLSTTETFKAALLKAKTVSYVNPASGGTSGTYFEGLLQKMGIAAAMKPKTVYRTQGSEVAAAVAAGEAELGVTFTSELAPTPGVKVAGTLPAEIQLPTIYAAAVVANAGSADAARAFIRALAGAEGRAALKKAGLEPVAAPAR